MEANNNGKFFNSPLNVDSYSLVHWDNFIIKNILWMTSFQESVTSRLSKTVHAKQKAWYQINSEFLLQS